MTLDAELLPGSPELARGLYAAARLIELRAAAIRAGFPAVEPDTELFIVADAIRRLAVRLTHARHDNHVDH